MSDVNTHKKITDIQLLPAARPGHSTGPTTVEGKSKSSGNANTHGCTSTLPVINGKLTPGAEARIVLPDENLADWEAVKEMWQTRYDATTDLHLTLVLSAAVADWLYRRTMRRLHDAQHHLFSQNANSFEWTGEQHQLLERFERYCTRAERSLARARGTVEHLKREGQRDLEKASAPKPFLVKSGPPAPPKPSAGPASLTPTLKTESSIIQCITVQTIDGAAFTLFQPRNEYLERMILNAPEPKPLVKRALYFMGDIPAEYDWIVDFEEHQDRPHFVIDRTAEEALADIARERDERTSHVLPPL